MSSLTDYWLQYKQGIQDTLDPIIRPWMDKAFERWEELNAREQLVLMALALTLVLAMLTLLFVYPLLEKRQQARDMYEAQVELLGWMQSVAPQLEGRGGELASTLNAQSMMATVNGTAAAYQIRLDRIQPEGGNKLRIWVESVSFNALMELLDDLQANAGIGVSSINIDADNRPGLVSARLVLQGQ